jgi:hypothetical protein
VSVPQSGRLARTDQPALHTVGREYLRELARGFKRAAEHLESLRRRRHSRGH